MKLGSIAGMIAARVLATIGLSSAIAAGPRRPLMITTVPVGAPPKPLYLNMPPPPPAPVDLGMFRPIAQPSGWYFGPARNQRTRRKAARQAFANGSKKAFR